jgi:hypothetical protein
VAEALPAIASRFGGEPELVSLVYLGRRVRLQARLSQMRIAADKDIIVCIESRAPLLLLSERFNGVPAEYRGLVERLVEATGAPNRVCERCLAMCVYNYDAALEELRSSGLSGNSDLNTESFDA